MNKTIKNVEFLSVVIDFYCIIPFGCLNIGGVYLEHEGRKFVLDTVESRWNNDNHHTTVTILLEAGIEGNTEDDPDCDFDLTEFDLADDNLKATIWFEEAIEIAKGEYVDPDSQTLFVKFLNDDGSGCTKAIDLKIE